MKHLITAIGLASTLFAPALAQQKAQDHSAHHAVAAALAADMTEGEVRKVDRAAKKLTIKHGEIRHMDMPAMTMAFPVRDVVLLAKLKAGDRIRFAVEKTATGLMVTDIRPAP